MPASRVFLASIVLLVALLEGSAAAAAGRRASTIAALAEATLPPQIRVQDTDMIGPVYADADGRTLYTWGGDREREKSNCTDTRYDKGRGVTNIAYYLADVAERPTCIQAWPLLVASADARNVGDWTTFARPDGVRQWAYKGKPVYRSALDEAPGDVNGVPVSGRGDVGGAGRTPIKAELAMPAGVTTSMTRWGLALAAEQGSSVLYVREGASLSKASVCTDACRGNWRPMAAAALASAMGDWTIVRGYGEGQWAYKGQPVFTEVRLTKDDDARTEATPGWRPLVIRPLPALPRDLTVQVSAAGDVYADRNGRSLYVFECTDETPDRPFCDVKGASSRPRMALCGGPASCSKTWPLVPAAGGAKSPNRTWTIVKVDKVTGAPLVDQRQAGVEVWAYRGRPVHTFSDDERPGDVYGDNIRTGVGGFHMLSPEPARR